MTVEQALLKLEDTFVVFHHPYKATFDGLCAHYEILGVIPHDLGGMRITLSIKTSGQGRKHITKIDLYDVNQISKLRCFLLEKGWIESAVELEADLIRISDLIQIHREQKIALEFEAEKEEKLDIRAEREAVNFLKGKHLIKKLDKTLESLGIVGEMENRLLIFLIALSYKTPYPLHGIILSTSGSGKSHLMNTIGDCFPSKDVISLTRITSKSLYHYKTNWLEGKLMLIQDFSGLDDESQYALRELQSAGKITTSTTRKDLWGGMASSLKTVHAHFSSLGASTKDIYFDNTSRSIVIRIDESDDQTNRIIDHQNKMVEGKSVGEDKEQSKHLLTNVIRVLQRMDVVNPFASKLKLPMEVREKRRLNIQLQHFILIVTWIHQRQRKTDKEGRLVTTKEDVLMGVKLFFESIMLKVDDLDGSTRQMFERIKDYTKKHGKSFTQKQIRDHLRLSKSHVGKALRKLVELEYISISSGSKNKGFTYKILHHDNNREGRERILNHILKQIESLR